MIRPVLAALLLTCVLTPAQETQVLYRFVGIWEAKWKDEVVCTILLKQGNPLSGETQSCSISVDANGNLQRPEPFEGPNTITSITNVKLQGETLHFEEQDEEEVTRFQLRLVGDGKAHLTFPNAPVRINPILFIRR